jgi:hypothetical protein
MTRLAWLGIMACAAACGTHEHQSGTSPAPSDDGACHADYGADCGGARIWANVTQSPYFDANGMHSATVSLTVQAGGRTTLYRRR